MYFNILFSIFMIVESIVLLKTGRLGYELYGSFYIADYKYIISLLFFLFGIYSGYQAYKSYKKQKINGKYINYSKCPNCEETYNYVDLNNGICPKCNIKTVDIDEFYK